MKRLRNRVIGLMLVASAGALLYRFGLTKEARENVKRALTSVKDAYMQIEGLMIDVHGITVAEPILPNRASTLSQWERFGY